VVGGEFFVMDYLMVFKPLTSRSLALRTGELHHCTMLVEKEASQPGAVQAGCSAYTSHRDLSVMAQRVEDEIQRAPYYRQVAHAAGNVASQLRALLGQSKAWANSLANDRLLHAHVTLPASLWKGSGTLEGTVTCLIPVRKELVPAAALQGAMGFTTVAAYGREMAQLQRALGGPLPPVDASTAPQELGDLLVRVQLADSLKCLALPLSMLARAMASGCASVQQLSVGQQLQQHVYAAASNPMALLG
jgi:hypothetical protein